MYQVLNGQVSTPYGCIPTSQVIRFEKLAGYRWDKENDNWIILQDRIEYWHRNNSPEKRSNEAPWYKREGWLPVRDYNFEYAVKKCKGDILKAMDYAEEKLFNSGMNPVYLPDRINLQQGKPTDDYTHRISYRKLIEEA